MPNTYRISIRCDVYKFFHDDVKFKFRGTHDYITDKRIYISVSKLIWSTFDISISIHKIHIILTMQINMLILCSYYKKKKMKIASNVNSKNIFSDEPKNEKAHGD